MKKLVLFIAIALLVVGATAAMTMNNAVATIEWMGQGTDSIDCTKYGPEGGMHWVLTGAKNVSEATIYVNGDPYPSTKVVATIHFDTPYYDLEGLTAYVEYQGILAKNAQLVISDYCPGYKKLEVEKTAAGSYDRTVTWELEKTVNPDEHWGFIGEKAGDSKWTVKATKTETLGNYKVVGDITIYNSNVFYVPFTVEDKLDDGTVAMVSCPTDKVPAMGMVICTYVAYPADDSATMNYAWVDAYVGADPYPAEAEVLWTEKLIGYDEGTLSDPRVDYSEVIDETTELEIPESFYCPSNKELYDENGYYKFVEKNTAYLNDNIDLEASAEVTVHCYAPVVAKDAETYFTRTWEWDIDKWGSTTEVWLKVGETADVTYHVKLSAIAQDSDYGVMGKIYIKNPHPTAPMMLTSVTDVISPDIAANVVCPTLTVPAAGQIECTYTADLPDPATRTNTATVKFNAIDFPATAPVDFTNADVKFVDQCVNVTDSKYGPLGKFCADDITYETVYGPYYMQVGPYPLCGAYEFVNCAKFVTEDTETTGEDCWTVKIIIPCEEGCTPGYWKNHLDAWWDYSPGQLISSVFVTDHCPWGDKTLLEGLDLGGGPGIEGKSAILLRAAIAALLNADHPDVGYPWSEAQIINKVNAALASHDAEVMENLAKELDYMNNLGCPLN